MASVQETERVQSVRGEVSGFRKEQVGTPHAKVAAGFFRRRAENVNAQFARDVRLAREFDFGPAKMTTQR